MREIGIQFPARGEVGFYDLGAPGELQPTQVLIGTVYSGITNGTERHALMAEHGWKQFPGHHGYQHVGQIEAVGGAVAEFRPGDWVFLGRYVGHRGWHAQDVAWTERRANSSHLCLALPDDVDRQQCALLGVAGVAMRAVRRCRVGPAQKVWVAGAGLIGQFAAQSARAVGARVTVTDVNERRLAIAAQTGAHRVLNACDTSTAAALQEGGPYDRILDACGVGSLFFDIDHDGLLASSGVIGALAVRSETTFPWPLLHGREASIEVSCHFSLDDLRVVLHFLRQGDIRIEPLITHRIPVAEAPAVYATLRDRPGEMLGTVFDWSG